MEREGKKGDFWPIFANFSKLEPQIRKVGKWGLRWDHKISKNFDFTSFGALRKKQSMSSLCC